MCVQMSLKPSTLGLREPANLKMTSSSVSLGSRWSLLFFVCPLLLAPCSLLAPCALLLPPVRPLPGVLKFPCWSCRPNSAWPRPPHRPFWHLPLLTAGPSPNQLVNCTCHKSPDSLVIRQFLPTRLPRLIDPKVLPTKVSTEASPKHPSAQNRKSCLVKGSASSQRPDLRRQEIMPSHPGVVSRRRSHRTTAHRTHSHAALSPVHFPTSPFHPSSQGPPSVCSQTNQTRTQNIVTPKLTLWASSSGNRRCCVVVVGVMLGPGHAMQRTCFIRRTAQHSSAACDTLATYGSHCRSRPPPTSHASRASKKNGVPIVVSHVLQVLSLQPQVTCLPACQPEIGLVASPTPVSGSFARTRVGAP